MYLDTVKIYSICNNRIWFDKWCKSVYSNTFMSEVFNARFGRIQNDTKDDTINLKYTFVYFVVNYIKHCMDLCNIYSI